jgi:hypothetical protein
MEIKSKYELKQRVFWLESNKVRSAIIKAIQFPRVYNDKSINHEECMYFVSNTTKSRVINWNGGGLKESEIFESKKELLKSL